MSLKKKSFIISYIIVIIIFMITASLFVKATYSYFTSTVGTATNVFKLGQVGVVFCTRENEGTTYTQSTNTTSANSVVLYLDETISNLTYGRSASLGHTLAIWNTASIKQYVRVGISVYIAEIVEADDGATEIKVNTEKDYGKYFCLGYSQNNTNSEPNSTYFVQSRYDTKYNSSYGDGYYYFINKTQTAYMPAVTSTNFKDESPYDLADCLYMYSREELENLCNLNSGFADYDTDCATMSGSLLQFQIYAETIQADFYSGENLVSAVQDSSVGWGDLITYPYPTEWIQNKSNEL